MRIKYMKDLINLQFKIVMTVFVLFMSIPLSTFATTEHIATKTTSKIYIDGVEKDITAYTINGHNYFKLRDLAAALNETTKQFDVLWDDQKNSIVIVKNKNYTLLDNQITISNIPNKGIATPTNSSLYIGEEKVDYTAYTINHSNYYMLRDLAKSLGFDLGWNAYTNTISISTTEEVLPNNQQNIKAGFNAKATLSPEDQYAYLNKELSKLKNEGIKTEKIWLRLNGGTVSQKTYPNDWSDDTVTQWAQLQQDFGLSYMFVVNFNDTPESQWRFYNRLTKSGIKFDAIELGNEQYLPKFAESNTEKYMEVTDRTKNMTPNKYIQMCNEYILDFKTQGIPFYVQFAPQKEDKINYANWNKRIAQAINNGEFLSPNIGGSIHLYEREGYGSLDVNQLNTTRSLVVKPISFAITESGVVDKKGKLSYEEFIEQEQYLTSRILEQLRGEDLFFNQVLYTDYKTVGPEIIHPNYNGMTPKGAAIINLLKKYW